MSSMPRLPGLPKIKTVNRCECGCPGLTGNRFVPGHDAKLLGMVKRVKAGVWTTDPSVTAQLDAVVAWATVNLPGNPERYAVAIARDMAIDYVVPSERKEEKAG